MRSQRDNSRLRIATKRGGQQSVFQGSSRWHNYPATTAHQENPICEGRYDRPWERTVHNGPRRAVGSALGIGMGSHPDGLRSDRIARMASIP